MNEASSFACGASAGCRSGAAAMAREIPLSHGRTAVVDDQDYARLSAMGDWRWTHSRGEGASAPGYAVIWTVRDGKTTGVWMHREVLGANGRVDHRDRDGLNNQRHNLRHCTHAQNCQNRAGWSGRLKGAWPHRRRWRSAINVNGQTIRLGSFATELEAALAYDQAARKYHGEFAAVNFRDLADQ